MLKAYEDMPVELFNRRHSEYSAEQRQFSLTLHLYSPKAYEFLRKTIPLPHASTLRRWLTGINGQPGISEQVFEVLQKNVADGNQAYRYCSLMLDAMSIRKQVDWDPNTKALSGFVNLGAGSADGDEVPVATEALVLMAVGIIGKWKAPLGYFLTNGSTGEFQTTIIKECMIKLNEIGITVLGVVCDGCTANQAMAKELGVKLHKDNLCSIFRHPANPDLEVAFFFDAVHMLKLFRNLLAAYQVLKIPNVGDIKWSYIEKLNQIQNSEHLHAANKISINHVKFENRKMKVKLAAQVLSSSTASALEFLEQINYKNFENVQATVHFIRVIDRLFDIFNSRNCYAKGFKKPVGSFNVAATRDFLSQCQEMLKTITDASDKLILESRRKMPALGFPININSLLWLIDNHLLNPDSPIKFLLMYKFSQDHLELFFNAVRRAGGWNNNPGTRQFAAAYRALLIRCDVQPTNTGNVTNNHNANIDLLDVSIYRRTAESTEMSTAQDALLDHTDPGMPGRELVNSSAFVENVLTYIAGYVARSLLRKISCDVCKSALVSDSPNDVLFITLFQVKNNGGLILQSESLRRVISISESVLRSMINLTDLRKCQKNWGLKLEIEVMSRLYEKRDLFPLLQEHMFDSEPGVVTHYVSLIKHIITEFLKIRRFYCAKKYTEKLHGPDVRKKLTKAILFKNQ